MTAAEALQQLRGLKAGDDVSVHITENGHPVVRYGRVLEIADRSWNPITVELHGRQRDDNVWYCCRPEVVHLEEPGDA